MALVPIDPDLVRRAQSGDGPSRDALLEQAYGRVFRYQVRLTGGRRDLAAELAQETMVRVIQSLDGLREQDRFLPWALRIATNLWRDRLRARREPEPLVAEPVAASTEPDDTVDAVVSQLGALAEPYRTALTLRYLEGLDYESMSDVLEVDAAVLRSQVARGLKQIRGRMNGELKA